MTKEQLKETLVWLNQEENRDALKLVCRELRYLAHHFRFRKISGAVTFGLEDPYTVGRILGLCSIFYPVYGETLSVTPVFDREVLDGDVSLNGRIRLVHLLVVGVKLYRNRTIREQIKKFM